MCGSVFLSFPTRDLIFVWFCISVISNQRFDLCVVQFCISVISNQRFDLCVVQFCISVISNQRFDLCVVLYFCHFQPRQPLSRKQATPLLICTFMKSQCVRNQTCLCCFRAERPKIVWYASRRKVKVESQQLYFRTKVDIIELKKKKKNPKVKSCVPTKEHSDHTSGRCREHSWLSPLESYR